MKKFTALLLVCILALACLAACGEKTPDSAGTPVDTLPDDLWGISMRADNVTATGMTLTVLQSGGDPTGDLQTGATYRLEQNIYDHWLPVDTILEKGEEYTWPEETHEIPKDGSCTLTLDWSDLYGTLPAGKYRLAKSVLDCRAAEDYDAFTFYAEFEITE